MSDSDFIIQLEQWMRENWETLLFILYFSLLAVFAVIETTHPRVERRPMRSKRWPTNFAITIMNIVLPPIVPISVLWAANYADLRQTGLLNLLEAGPIVAIVATLAVRSLLSYVMHYLNHKVPFLWRLHRVHHSDIHLDVSTTVRFHPLEFLPSLVLMVPLTIAFGLSPWVLMFYEVLDAVINLFSHSNIRIADYIDRALRFLFVTPDMHRIHHSAWQPETDSNYGAVFSFWDRLFRTYVEQPKEGHQKMVIGLEEVRGLRANSLIWQLWSPFVSNFTDEKSCD